MSAKGPRDKKGTQNGWGDKENKTQKTFITFTRNSVFAGARRASIPSLPSAIVIFDRCKIVVVAIQSGLGTAAGENFSAEIHLLELNVVVVGFGQVEK